MADFRGCGWGVAAGAVAGVAQHRVGDEDRVAVEAGRGEEPLEVAAGLVAAERNGGAVAAEAAGGLGDEADAGVERAVGGAEEADAALHAGAGAARPGLIHQMSKRPDPRLPDHSACREVIIRRALMGQRIRNIGDEWDRTGERQRVDESGTTIYCSHAFSSQSHHYYPIWTHGGGVSRARH